MGTGREIGCCLIAAATIQSIISDLEVQVVVGHDDGCLIPEAMLGICAEQCADEFHVIGVQAIQVCV